MTILYFTLANHQIRHQATHERGDEMGWVV